MDMDPMSPRAPPHDQDWSSGSYSSGGESPPGGRRRPPVVPVEDHLELANAVLNGTGPRINCPVGDEEDEEGEESRQHRTAAATATAYQSGPSISCN
jgi:hypothetical protein